MSKNKKLVIGGIAGVVVSTVAVVVGGDNVEHIQSIVSAVGELIKTILN